MSKKFSWLHKWGSPKYFYLNTAKLCSVLGWLSLVLILTGITYGLFFAPADYQQKDAYRIIYIHVPAAFLSMAVYSCIAFYSLVYLVWKIKVVDILAKVSAPIGATFTFIALVTGAIWGKPMWGTWWVWDARLTSELLLLFIYFGYIGLRNSFDNNPTVAAKASALLGVIGFINIPIIHFSVEWWHTLHQGPTISKFSKPDIDFYMLLPLVVSIIGFFILYGFLAVYNARTEVLWRERNSSWLKYLVNK